MQEKLIYTRLRVFFENDYLALIALTILWLDLFFKSNEPKIVTTLINAMEYLEDELRRG